MSKRAWTAIIAVALTSAARDARASTPDAKPAPADEAAREKADTPAIPKPADEDPPRRRGAPDGFVEMKVAAVLATKGGPAVVLRDAAEEALVPIWIGASEAHSIQLRLDGKRFPRPLTHDLLDAIVHDLGGTIVEVHVDDLEGEAFVGTVFVRHGKKTTRYDARASDVIALAVGNDAPIYVSKAVITRVQSRRNDVEREPDTGDDDDDELDERPVPQATGAVTL
ncbi:bifunctional nuclease family protein [Myxococcota bacterium]|nr:bifunctional nuclease family protein [Myxococcota bacterium]